MKTLTGYWYHYAIMFEALFILTTVDTGTRVARYVMHELLGKVHKPFSNTAWLPGNLVTSAIVVAELGIPDLYRQHLHAVAAVWHRQSIAGHHRAGSCDHLPGEHGQGQVRVHHSHSDVLCRCHHVDGRRRCPSRTSIWPLAQTPGHAFQGYLDSGLMVIFIVGVVLVLIESARRCWKTLHGVAIPVEAFGKPEELVDVGV